MADGTIEYYKVGGAGTALPNQLTYNNLILSNSGLSNQTLIFSSPSAPTTYTINGDFSITRSGAGTMNVVLANSANIVNLNISGGVAVSSGSSLTCSLNNAIHNISVGGDFINNGSVDLSNSAQYVAATNGAANLIFTGTINSDLSCSGVTDVYSLTVNKGTDQTYILHVYASLSSNFRVFTNGTALVITNGTLRLGTNISLTRINGGGNFDVSTAANSAGGLWVDGADLILNGGCNAIVVYGKFRISAGNFQIGNEGLVIRFSGQILIEGGTSIIEKYRSSTIGGVHIGSFTMTGGTVTIDGSRAGSSNADSPRFSHPFPGQSFIMSGGTMNIAAPETGTATNGGILIACDPSNISVTGGTWNVTLPASATNFNICSTAPFYDLNILKAGAGASVVTLNNQVIGPSVIEPYRPSPVLAQPLVVLNNLTLVTGNSPTLSAGTQNVVVSKNFEIQASTTYNPGTNTTIFNGTGSQTFTNNGTITSGLNNLTVDKPVAKSLFLAGSAATFNVLGTLTILNGTLADAGKTVNVAGNIVNSGNHTGAGSIVLNGTGAQQLGGNGTGKFNNLSLNKTAGSATLTANQTVNGTLRLANAAAIFDLSTFNLSLSLNTNIYDALVGVGTTFSNTKMIRTAGNASDGGLSKRFSAVVSSFTYPLGSGVEYTPSTFQVTGAATTYGTVTVRPAALEQPNVLVTGRCLTYYWKVTQSGFNLGPATVTQTFQYADADIVAAGDVSEAEYVPGRFRLATNSWASTTPADINTATNTITFTGASFNTLIDGDYTAGDNNPTDPFATILTYYSMRNGDWDDTNPATTPWSTVGHSGPAAGTIPGPSNPVEIGNGTSINHTVTVSNNGKTSGSLTIGNNSVLDLGTTTNHNFSTYFIGLIPSQGTLRISSSAATAQFPGGDFGSFLGTAGGTVEYYTTGVQDFLIPTTSFTAFSLANYRNLTLALGTGRSITFPNIDLLIHSTLNINGASSTGLALLNGASSRNLTVTQNLNVLGGNLRFQNNNAQSLSIGSSISITAGAIFDVSGAGTAVSNTISVAANITNNGTLDFNAGGGRVCNITFTGAANRTFGGSTWGATTDVNLLTVNKGTSQSPVLTLNVLGAFTAPSNNWLTLTNGTLTISKAVTLTLTNAAATNFTIPANAALVVNNASAIINIAQAASDASDLILAGKLQINAGTVNIGVAGNNNNNDIEYAASSAPQIILTGGALNVNGQIRRNVSITTGALVYDQSGSSAVVIRGRNADLTRGKLEIDNPASAFNMAGNATLTIERGAGTTYGDLYLAPASSTVTGGTIIFQQGNINTNQTYRVDSTVPLFNLTASGSDANDNATVQLVVQPLILKGSLVIANSFSVFNANGRNVSIQGNLTNSNTNAATGFNVGGYRAGSATQLTTFNSSSANQTISGIGANLTNFSNLTINNTFSSGVVSLSASSNIRVSATLTLTEGTLQDGANTITCIGNIDNSSVHASTGAGRILCSGTVLQILSGDNTGQFGNLTINNSLGLQSTANIQINNTLTFTLGSIYIDNKLLTFNTSAAVAGTVDATKMIKTNGALSDSGVVKVFASGASSFTFPVGVGAKYTPVTYNVTANAAPGTIQLKNINNDHPATTDAGSFELGYYWSVRSTGFSGLAVTHTYNYLNADVSGTEASYVTGRFLSGAWNPIGGTPGTVNDVANTISLAGVNYLDGDFTAGETNEFSAIATLYSRDATFGGNWDDVNTWSSVSHAGPAAGFIPTFHNVIIAAGHTVNSNGNFRTSSTLQINGTLDLANDIGNNFGTVSGNGIIRISATGGGSFIFPGGSYVSTESEIVIDNLEEGKYSVINGNSFCGKIGTEVSLHYEKDLSAGFSIEKNSENALLVKLIPDQVGSDIIRWNFGDGSVIEAEGETQHTYSSGGNFIVQMEKINGECRVVGEKQIVIGTNDNGFEILNNQDVLKVKYVSENSAYALIEITNLSGQVVSEVVQDYFNASGRDISIAHLSPGIYMVNIKSNGKILSKKIFKE